jgi:hypothetical protein
MCDYGVSACFAAACPPRAGPEPAGLERARYGRGLEPAGLERARYGRGLEPAGLELAHW